MKNPFTKTPHEKAKKTLKKILSKPGRNEAMNKALNDSKCLSCKGAGCKDCQ